MFKIQPGELRGLLRAFLPDWIHRHVLVTGSIGFVYRAPASPSPAPPPTLAPTPVAQLHAYVGCREDNTVDRPCGATAFHDRWGAGMQSKGYIYFGLGCTLLMNTKVPQRVRRLMKQQYEWRTLLRPSNRDWLHRPVLTGCWNIRVVYRRQTSPPPALPTLAPAPGDQLFEHVRLLCG